MGMRLIRNLLLVLAVAVLGLVAGRSASAATITYDVHFGLAGLSYSGAPPTVAAPVPFVLGGFHITLDPTGASFGSVPSDYFNLPVASPIEYSFDPSGSTVLSIGGSANGLGGATFGQNDFAM